MIQTESEKSARLSQEIQSFQSLWKGGFVEGDCLDPLGRSSYAELGYMSVLYATYLACIKPYIHKDTVALEIGPGRGAWTRALLPGKEVWCLDALSAEHNEFFQFLGNPKNVKYFQVEDFSCRMLPDNTFDYFFTFGCFCHISFSGISEYMKNLYPKFKDGAHGFMMVADYDKYNKAGKHARQLNILWRMFPRARDEFLRLIFRKRYFREMPREFFLDKQEDEVPRPGRWYHAGVDRTCKMLEDLGYKIVDRDVGVIHRDPVIHFTK